jgi:tRNA pseudouridine(38-40) synthase
MRFGSLLFLPRTTLLLGKQEQIIILQGVGGYLNSNSGYIYNALASASSDSDQSETVDIENDYYFQRSGGNNKEATSVVLQVAYDGLHFHGWTAANSDEEEDSEEIRPIPYFASSIVQSKLATSSKRKSSDAGIRHSMQRQQQQPNKNIRTVQKTLSKAFAKIYGNVPLDLITVEGCSRTDRGVSAIQLVAHVYCTKTTQAKDLHEYTATSWPVSPIDPRFEVLPFDGDLHQIIYVLNRMIPFDVRVLKAAYLPSSSSSTSTIFHPSLSAISKTYMYRMSIPQPGTVYDPLQWRHMWNIVPSSSPSSFDLNRAKQACELFKGSLDLKAFRGALRGSDRKSDAAVKSNTICNITYISIMEEGDQSTSTNNFIFDLYGASPPNFLLERGIVVGSTAFQTTAHTVIIRGDRFLYKMCRFIVGVIVAAGYGKITLMSVRNAIQSGSWELSSSEAGKLAVSSSENDSGGSSDNGGKNHHQNYTLPPKFECAPSHGLVLIEVEYPEALSPQWQSS